MLFLLWFSGKSARSLRGLGFKCMLRFHWFERFAGMNRFTSFGILSLFFWVLTFLLLWLVLYLLLLLLRLLLSLILLLLLLLRILNIIVHSNNLLLKMVFRTSSLFLGFFGFILICEMILMLIPDFISCLLRWFFS